MIDYLDNKLEKELCQEIEKHVETCERCLDALRDTQRVMELISRDEMIEPDESMRINFYHMLHSEIKKNEIKNNEIKISDSFIVKTGHWYNSSHFRIAAGFAILICGTLLGMFIQSGIIKSDNSVALAQLQSEVANLKRTAMFIMLNNESSSERIQAVNYADEIDKPGEKVIEALVKTLNYDKNVNVRMAAAYALAKYITIPSVADSLVKSLSLQNDPIMQVTLINILVEKKDKSAIKPIQNIITNTTTLKEVRKVAEDGIKMLI